MSRSTRDQRGASALEMSILAPVFLLLVFTIIEFALWMHGRNVAVSAAREGVASLRIAQSFEDTGQITENAEIMARNTAADLGMLRDHEATATYDAASEQVQVTVEGTVIDLIPGVELRVEGSASGYIEEFRPDFGLDDEQGGE